MATPINPLDAERVFFRDFFGAGTSPGFGCQLRKIAAEVLMNAFDKETDDDRRRLICLNLHQQICLTFEDVGAVMLAIERKLSASADFLETYLTYSPGEAYVSKVIAGKSDKEIMETFGFGQELQDLYTEHKIPREELWKRRKNFLSHVKSLANIQDERKTLCNKMKHGSVILSRGGENLSAPGDASQMCSLSFKKDKVTGLNVWNTDSFHYSDEEVRTWFRVTSAAPLLLQGLAFQYVLRFHSDLRVEWLEEMGLT